MTFHRTTYHFTVLSEGPIPAIWELETILHECDEGQLVFASMPPSDQEELTGEQMAAALYEAGSDPGFFQLDDDGNEQEEAAR